VKIRTLDIVGIGPFKNRQFIDFTKFEQEGLFLIDGATGAGKTTILDAIIFALYDTAPRWGVSKKNAKYKSLRSKYLGPDDISSVALTFEVFDGLRWQEYRATRTLKLGKSGEEKEKEKDTRTLELKDSKGDFETIEVGKTAVALRIIEILGLTQDEFLKVAMLAQGQFGAFLEADTDARLTLMRKLFDTERFDKITKQVEANAKEAKSLVGEQKSAIDSELRGLTIAVELDRPVDATDSEWLTQMGTMLESQLEPLEAAAQAAQEAFSAAEQELETSKLQTELRGYVEALNVLEKESPVATRKADQTRLAEAEKASYVTGAAQAAEEAEASFQEATEELAKISQSLPASTTCKP